MIKKCDQCKTPIASHDGTGVGYAMFGESRICYGCCAIRDTKSMIEHGDSKRLPLYLAENPNLHGLSDKYIVSNWPGTLKFMCRRARKSKHNIDGSRTDVWFNGPDGHVWHGTQYGDFTQIVHCKRTKERCR